MKVRDALLHIMYACHLLWASEHRQLIVIGKWNLENKVMSDSAHFDHVHMYIRTLNFPSK